MPPMDSEGAITAVYPSEGARRVVEDERRILEMIATGVQLKQVLEAITLLFEEHSDEVRASILLIENGSLMRPGAAPSLPSEYMTEIDGLAIGLNAGSCGSAAFTKQRVIVEDIDSDPRWAECKGFVLGLGFRACWSTPVIARDGEVLGSFGIYSFTRRTPSKEELALADRAAHLAAIALERQRADARLHVLHEQLEARIRTRTEQLERAVAELSAARESAEAASAAKSRFLANVSHEIRTPLNAVLGFAQLLSAATDLNTRHTSHVRAIQTSGEHLLALINGVLEMSKIEAGHLTVVNGTFDLHKLLGDIERMFRLRAQDKQLDFCVELASGVPHVLVADAGKLRQVLINLVGNAIKFTDRGHVHVRARGTRTTGGKLRLSFEIDDSGSGMCEAGLRELFQPFAQVSDPARRLGGTGLGLAISKHFVESMGGSVSVTSTPGVGSTFRFDALAEIGDACALLPAAHTSTVELASNAPRSILVVDDSDLNRRLMLEILRPLGFSVWEARNGAEGVSAYEQRLPAVVLMDIRMPVMDGYEAMRRIRALPGAARVRIVAVTASAFEEDVPEIMASGADEVLRKPFRTEKLLATIARQLEALPPLVG